jgi:hypothetical protein
MKMKAPAILKNKYVLYLLLVVALINVLGYLSIEDYKSLGLFISVGLLSTYFSKNMAVTLIVAILVTAIVAINDKVKEGLENKKDEKDENKDKKEESDEEKFSCSSGTSCPSGKKCTEQSQCKEKSGFQNNVPPSSPAKVDDDDESPGDRIDYAATMEQAYDNLQKMLGEDGVKGITSETKKLVAQQKDLMGTLNSMAPVLNTAKETLESMNMPDMAGMANMLKQLNGKAPDISKLTRKGKK